MCDREFDEQQQRARCSTGAIVVHVLRDAPARRSPLVPPRFLNPCGGASDSDSDSGAVLDVRMPLSRPLYLTHLVLAPPAHEAELRVVAVPAAAASRASRRDADTPPSPALSALFFVERSLWANMSLQLEADVPFIFGVCCTQYCTILSDYYWPACGDFHFHYIAFAFD